MKLKGIMGMVIVLLALGSVYFYEIRKEKSLKMVEERQKKVFNIERSQIASIEIYETGKEPIKIERDGDWKIKSPVNTKVDMVELERYLNTLDTTYMSRVIVEKEENLHEFGLNEPQAKISITGHSGKETLLIGSPVPAEFAYYAKKEGEDRVFVVDDHKIKDLTKDLFTFRYKRLVELKPQEVEGVFIKTRSFELELKRGEGGWGGIEGLDGEKVDLLLGRILWAQAKKVARESKEDLSSFGLVEPDLVLKIRSGHREESIKIGIRQLGDEKSVYGESDTLGCIFEMPSWIAEYIPKDISNLLRDRKDK